MANKKRIRNSIGGAAKAGAPAKKLSPRQNRDSGLASATLRNVRISPRKIRLSLDMVKGQQVEQALQMLQFNTRKGSAILAKLLKSAISNAKERHGADVDNLWVTGGSVTDGPIMMRYMPAAHGRANPVRKRSAHVTILLDQK
jgi:large subunit ribosomal protein L22